MRIPLVSMLVVALAVAAMVALGLWQLVVRLPEKEALLAELAANPGKPPVAMPAPPRGEDLLYRQATAACAAPATPTIEGAGGAGFRVIVRCPAGAGGFLVQLGTSRAVEPSYRFAGGPLSGYLTHAPDHRPALASLFDSAPPELMLVLDQPATGLLPNPGPDPEAIPNNHLAYAVQWFIFAALAVLIYALVLRRRRRPAAVAATGG